MLIVGALLVMGCRRQPPPAPLQGWVRLSALTPLHPNQAMLADIDHRLATLARQRQQLLNAPGLPPPAYDITETTPALTALPVPAAVISPATPDAHAPDLRDQDEFHARAQRAGQRELTRAEWTIRSKYDVELEDLLSKAKANNTRQRSEFSKIYSERMFNAKLRAMRLTGEETEAKKQYELALDQYRAAQKTTQNLRDVMSTLSSNSSLRLLSLSRAQQKLREAVALEEQLKHRVDTLSARANAATEANRQAEESMRIATNKFNRDMLILDNELQNAITQTKDGVNDSYQTDFKATKTAIDQRIKERIAAWSPATQAPEPIQITMDPPPGITLPEIPGGTLTLDATRFRATLGAAKLNGVQQRLAGVQAIDDVATALTLRRHALRAAITRDTQTAARALATQHGYVITVDAPRGAEITDQVHHWLQDYWPGASAVP